MEWLIILIVVMTMPLWMIFWWIPRCDAVGIRQAKNRIAREPVIMTLAVTAAPSQAPLTSGDLFRTQEKVLS